MSLMVLNHKAFLYTREWLFVTNWTINNLYVPQHFLFCVLYKINNNLNTFISTNLSLTYLHTYTCTRTCSFQFYERPNCLSSDKSAQMIYKNAPSLSAILPISDCYLVYLIQKKYFFLISNINSK